jgi:hypothetical protein
MTELTGERTVRFPAVALAGMALLAAAAVLADAAVQSAVPASAITRGSLAVTALCAAAVCMLTARGCTLGAWKTGPWMMAWSAMSFGGATLTWGDGQSGAAGLIQPSSITRALWLTAMAVIMWMAGYAAGPGRAARALAARCGASLRHRVTGDIRSAAAPWLLYAAGTIARAASLITTGHLGYLGNPATAVSTATGYGQVIALAGMCAPMGLATAALRAYREDAPGSRLPLAVLFLAEVSYAAVSGDKQNFAVAVLAVAIPFTAARRKLPRAALAAAAAVFLVAVIPFTAAYRADARTGSAAPLTPAQAAEGAPGILGAALRSESGVTSAVTASASYLLARNQDIDAPAIIMQDTPSQIPYGSPAGLVTAPLAALVPRALWPSKPVLATGYQFAQQYLGLPPGTYTSATITPEGDLYRHGGWVPVIAGMFLLGALVRLLDDSLDVRASPHAVLLLLLLLPALVMAEQDWVTLLADIPGQLLVWWAACRVAFRPVLAERGPVGGGSLHVRGHREG